MPRASLSCSTPAVSRAAFDRAPSSAARWRGGTGSPIVIDGCWPDASGRPLGAGSSRSFTVVAADLEPPEPARWRIEPPRAGGRGPLRVALGEPLDSALLQRLVWVEDEAGRRPEGSIALGDDERSWTFTPAAPWSAGRYALTIDRRLEDLAGNRVGRAFEVDLERAPSEDAHDDRRTPADEDRSAYPGPSRRQAPSSALSGMCQRSRWPGAPACAPSRAISRSPALLRPA